MMCQTTDGANCEDGVAPEGALQSGDGGEAYYDALMTIASYPITLTKPPENMDAFNMQLIAQGALEGFTDGALHLSDGDGAEAVTYDWEDCGFGFCGDCGAGLIDDFPCLRCRWRERRSMGLSVWRPCDCHRHEHQVCDVCQGMPQRIQRPDEEDRRSDEVDAEDKSASLTPQNLEAKAREIVENGPVIFGRESMAHYEAAILHALREERERAAKIASDEADLQRAKWSHLVQNGSSQTARAFAKGGAESAKRIAAAIRGEDNG